MPHFRENYNEITDKLGKAGLRPTRQRVMLGSLLWGQGCRHVTAEGLFAEAKEHNIKVSLATIYNTLHQFTEAGLLREIVTDSGLGYGGRSYFDTNIAPHHHFLHEDTGTLEDIDASAIQIGCVPLPPSGKSVTSVDVVIRVRAAG